MVEHAGRQGTAPTPRPTAVYKRKNLFRESKSNGSDNTPDPAKRLKAHGAASLADAGMGRRSVLQHVLHNPFVSNWPMLAKPSSSTTVTALMKTLATLRTQTKSRSTPLSPAMHSTSPNVLTIGINAVTRLLERLVADQRQTSAQLLSASGKPAALTSRYIVLVPVADITAKMLISHLPILAGLCGPDRVLLLGLPQGCGPELTKALAIKAVSAVAISSQAPDFQPMWQRLQAVHKPARMPWLEPFRPKKSIKAKPLDTSKPTTRTTGTVGVVINPSNQAVDSPGVLGTLTLPPTTSHPPSHGALARCFGSGAVKCVKTTAPMKRSKQKTPKAATSKQ